MLEEQLQTLFLWFIGGVEGCLNGVGGIASNRLI